MGFAQFQKMMEELSIIAETNEKEVLQKLRAQLDAGQKAAGHVEQMLAESRNLLLAYSRKTVNIHYENLSDMIVEAAKSSEVLTEKMRRLVLEMTLDKRKYERYKSDVVLIHGIKLKYQDEILCISLPVLIPHRKAEYTDYIYRPLYTAFQHWCMQQAENNQVIPEYKNCTVCFFHLYDKNLPLYRVRDHDNMEEKHVLDVIANFFLTSDSGYYTSTYHETRMEEKDRTVIYLIPAEVFPSWLQEKREQTISNFL